jgi:hypothetical protein
MDVVFWWGLLGVLVWFVFVKGFYSKSVSDKISPIIVFLSFILTIAVSMLFHQIFGDITDNFCVSQSFFRCADNYLQVLIAHSLVAMPLLVLGVLFYFIFYSKGSKAKALTIPYLVSAGLITLRFLWEIGYFMIDRYNKIGIYAVLIFVIVCVSLLAWGVGYYLEKKKEIPQ